MRVIVLAAGASTRMGHPKALTRIDGTAALERIIDACEVAGLARPLVVLGAAHAQIVAALPGLASRADLVTNPDPHAGRTGSLQCGLARVDGPLLMWPVDHPLVLPDTLRTLIATPGAWVVPIWGGRAGHPIVLRDDALAAVRGASAATPLRDILRDTGVEPMRVAVPDEGVVANLDTPADVEASRVTREGHP